ncbi:hypothetical protein EP867_16120 [Falsigemmobacter intermedius]|uniref:Alpha/beta hydrolase n=1 Tax=Falsigemmobacter intermedius TaxID=1553448 RepID=A0A451GHP7_9RHOB|nr:hypothetical protein [Falsigemmobacter intermedius]RWY38484.1 hypothetical protein EP867_16120 [Falsigemmobacter intermedius]
MAMTEVRRRLVFYIPGFDPFPPRRYRELYRREGAEQARLSGYELTLLPAPGGGRNAFEIASKMEGVAVSARYEVLPWHDLVRRAMPEGIGASYLQLLRTARVYIGSGALWPLVGLRKGPMIASFYPVAVLLAQLFTALVAGWLTFRLAAGWLPVWLAAGPGLLVVWGILHLCQRLDRRIFAHYLMHDFAYVARLRGAYPADLSARIDEFSAKIRAALTAADVDEVLVIGHSSGVHLGVSALSRLLAEGLPERRAELSFLSLGQAVPMVSFLTDATELRRDLRRLSAQDQIAWIDVTAPSDGCTFALCDPVAVSGVAPPDQRWPLVLSAAFTQTLSPAKRRSLRGRFFRLHFQYLCAFDRLPQRSDAYDFFRITAGPMTLRDRLGGRRPSAGRITRAASKYQSTAP